MKAIKYVLIVVLTFVVIVISYYTIDRYLINDNAKGINPKDILNSCLFLVLPITIALFVLKRIKK
ncbi:MAG: hypothetical protein R2797_11950 [Gelidibacter sp.]